MRFTYVAGVYDKLHGTQSRNLHPILGAHQSFLSVIPHCVIQLSSMQEIGQQATEQKKTVQLGCVESKSLGKNSNFMFSPMFKNILTRSSKYKYPCMTLTPFCQSPILVHLLIMALLYIRLICYSRYAIYICLYIYILLL